MTKNRTMERRILEIMLVVVTIGMTYLLYRMGGYKMVVLNLFYLPIVLSGYFLGRTYAGVLALFSVLAVTIATILAPTDLAAFASPIMMGLALTVWAAALGLTALLVGTLCDERAKTVEELHAAYVGVVEVLSKYLQSGNPKVKARSTRVAELSQAVAENMRLPGKEVDDVCVGALLYDLGNVEITTHLLNKAVGTLEANPAIARSHTFLGMDLVHSLGSVLRGALPLVLEQDDAASECLCVEERPPAGDVPQGAKIIRAVRAYDALTYGTTGELTNKPDDTLREMRRDVSAGFDPEVLHAIERCTRRPVSEVALEPAHV